MKIGCAMPFLAALLLAAAILLGACGAVRAAENAPTPEPAAVAEA